MQNYGNDKKSQNENLMTEVFLTVLIIAFTFLLILRF